MVIVVFGLSACGNAGGGATVQTYPASPQNASPPRESSPSMGTSPSSQAAWRLPVATGNGGNAAIAGFISLPTGAFSADHQGDLANNSVGNPPLTGTASGTNVATYPSYDLQQHRWVPVTLRQLSPDGSQYAYAEWVMPAGPINGPTPPSAIRIHVVDVSAAADRIIYTTSKQLLSVVAFLTEGIYVTNQCWEGCGGVGGMWLLNPSTGDLSTVLTAEADHTDWRLINNGIAWGIGPWGGPDQIGDKIFRLDISTRSVTRWSTPTNFGDLVGVDSRGFPLVQEQDPYTGAVKLWDEDSPTSGSELFTSPTVVHFSAPTSGPCGTLIGSTAGLYQFTSDGALQVVSTDMPIQPAGLVVAGPCVAA